MSKKNWRKTELIARQIATRKIEITTPVSLKYKLVESSVEKFIPEMTAQDVMFLMNYVHIDLNSGANGRGCVVSNIAHKHCESAEIFSSLIANTIIHLATKLKISPDAFLGKIATETAKLDEEITKKFM